MLTGLSRNGSWRPLLAAVLVVCVAVAMVWSQRFEVLPNFSAMPVAEKKQQFFDLLLPVITQENGRLEGERQQWLAYQQQLTQGQALSSWRLRQLSRARDKYLPEAVSGRVWSDKQTLDELLHRVDSIPASLILVQAAKESGWGTSRFARLGNNLFGQQCFTEGCGFVPKRREPGRYHEVARYHSVRDAVRAYMFNLNTHRRYERFRTLRQQQRDSGLALSGSALAEGLAAYSERGERYVSEIVAMIRHNQLEQ